MSEGRQTDSLLLHAATGDQRAFQLLFDEHRAFLRCVVERRLDARVRARVDASDIVQETQLTAFKKLEDFLARRPMTFRLWLIRTALQHLQKTHRYHLATQARSANREFALPEESSLLLADHLIDGSSSPSSKAHKNEMVRHVQEALKSISDADRDIILFRLFEGLSNREVACLLSLAPDTAKKRFARALQKLRKELEVHGARLENDGV
jgi:RNA polymerase sigma-70 factor (ECF subfamily)